MASKKWLRTAGYVAFALATFLLFFYLTFPAGAVAQRMAQELSSYTGGAMTVTFEDASLYRFSGLQADNVKLRAALGSDEGTASTPIDIELDNVWVRVQILPLALLDISVSAGARIGDGSLEGRVDTGGEGVGFELEIDELDFAESAILGKLAGLPVGGTIAGSATGTIGAGAAARGPKTAPAGAPGLAPDRSEGKASLTIRDASVGPGTVAGFTVPAPIGFGQIDIAFDMRKGRLRLASFQQKGGQVALKASGGLTLRRNLRASALDTCLQFKFVDEAYLTKYPKIGAALQLAQVELKKDGDGFMHIKHGGTIGSPRKQRGLCRRGPGRNKESNGPGR